MKKFEKKYILIDETINCNGHTLHRIKAVRDFSDVKAGDLGGFIEREENLSHDGDCWVYYEAKVYEEAKVYDDAKILDRASVFGYAEVHNNAKVFGYARVYGDTLVCENALVFSNATLHECAEVCGNSRVYGCATVYGYACIRGNSSVSGNAKIFGYARVFGEARIRKNALISTREDYLSIGPIGSRDDFTTFYKGIDDDIYVSCGCFSGTIEEFRNAVVERHGDNEFKKQYYKTISYAEQMFNLV